MTGEEKVGIVIHYYGKISVAVIELSGKLTLGDKIRIRGLQTDFMQNILSMQVEHKKIAQAEPGDLVGLKVNSKVREGDELFIING